MEDAGAPSVRPARWGGVLRRLGTWAAAMVVFFPFASLPHDWRALPPLANAAVGLLLVLWPVGATPLVGLLLVLDFAFRDIGASFAVTAGWCLLVLPQRSARWFAGAVAAQSVYTVVAALAARGIDRALGLFGFAVIAGAWAIHGMLSSTMADEALLVRLRASDVSGDPSLPAEVGAARGVRTPSRRRAAALASRSWRHSWWPARVLASVILAVNGVLVAAAAWRRNDAADVVAAVAGGVAAVLLPLHYRLGVVATVVATGIALPAEPLALCLPLVVVLVMMPSRLTSKPLALLLSVLVSATLVIAGVGDDPDPRGTSLVIVALATVAALVGFWFRGFRERRDAVRAEVEQLLAARRQRAD